MKFSYKLLFLLPIVLLMVACPQDDTTTVEEIRDYQSVYTEDILEIETFMQEHFMTVDAEYNVIFTKITTTTPGTPIKDRADLQFKTVTKNDVPHKLYYIKLREGLGDNPTKLDSIYSSYKGHKTDLTSFDSASNPVWFELQGVIQGWSEIFPEFKKGTSSLNSDGTITFNDFGAGVMFVPSGLAYFNRAAGSISSYTPIIFNFKLMDLKYKDHDGDKILSKDEYGPSLSADAIDTDGDGRVDYGDFDDDNDGVLTKTELKNTLPAIPKDSKGNYIFTSIPTCPGGNGLKRHLNASCQ